MIGSNEIEQRSPFRPEGTAEDEVTKPRVRTTPEEPLRVRLWLVATIVLVTSLVAWIGGRTVAVPRRPLSEAGRIRSVQELPPATILNSGGLLSPDTTHLAFVAEDEHSGKTRLWIRDLATGDVHVLGDTEGAEEPFWSPDGQHLAFFSNSKLRIVDLRGSPAQTITTVSLRAAGGSWSAGGTILFAPRRSGLYSIAASGGPVTSVSALDTSAQESAHRSPHFLPDGRHFLYYVASAALEHSGTYVGSIDGREKVRLVEGSRAIYSEPGYIAYLRNGVLITQSF